MLQTNRPPEIRTTRATPTRGPDGPQYVYNQTGHHLSLAIRGVTDAQVSAVLEGESEFALFVEEPLILVGSRFGEALPWTVATFCWHLVPRPMRNLPPVAGLPGEAPIRLAIRLVEARDGSVRAARERTLGLDFTRALHEAIRDQARMTFDPRALERAQAGLLRHYPTPGAVVARALVRSIGVD